MASFGETITAAFGDWVMTYAPFILLAAMLFAFLFVITVIAAVIRACVLKGRIKKLTSSAPTAQPADEAQAMDTERLAALESELEQKQLRIDELEGMLESSNNDELYERCNAMSDRIEAQSDELNAKQAQIDELENELKLARSANANASSSATDDESARKIAELERTVKDKDSEINLLKAENAQIKAQALQQQLAETKKTAATSSEPTQKATAQKAAPQKTAAQKTAQSAAKPVVDEPKPSAEDEYDEYYDDYGDETSAIKVTLKFDRVKNSWVVLRSDTDRAYRRLATKQEALMIAKDLARRLHAQLVVHKKDGKFQHV